MDGQTNRAAYRDARMHPKTIMLLLRIVTSEENDSNYIYATCAKVEKHVFMANSGANSKLDHCQRMPMRPIK